MPEQVKYYLRHDVHSVVKSSRVYGKMNQAVTVIARNGHVWLVENEIGDRFPVVQDDLKELLKEEEKVDPRPDAEKLLSDIQSKKEKVIRKTNHRKKDDSPSLF